MMIAIVVLILSSVSFGYSGGSGTAGDPYQIATKADLLALAANTADYAKYFILTADVNMEEQVFTTAIITADTSSDDYFQGTAFTGMFDGNGHKITHFTIDGGINWCRGLFGYIASGSSVKNLGLESITVIGGDNLRFLGGLAGANGGTIINCYSTGNVNGGNNSRCLGGLAGATSGTIINCYSTGNVSSGNDLAYLGGLAGLSSYESSSISNCYSIGNVAGGYDTTFLGGLVGENSGTIINCYSIGDVASGDESENLGGLAGSNYYGSISDCYSIGNVSSGSSPWNLGGLAGSNYYSTISNSYFLVTSGPDNGCGTPLTNTQMKQKSSFVGWDIENVWDIIENTRYPFLQCQKTFPNKAAELAKQVIGANYLWGGKGFCRSEKRFLESSEIFNEYTYWNQNINNWDSGSGLDCSGLVFWSYNKAYGAQNYQEKSRPHNPINEPGADGQYRLNSIGIEESELSPGDLLFFDTPPTGSVDHVAMYVGNYSYPGGVIGGTNYPAGTYDCVEARGYCGVIPRTLQDLINNPYFLGFRRVVESQVGGGTVSARCPVNIILTDPDGFTISRDIWEVPGVLYYSVYIDKDGERNNMVTIAGRKVGTYLITVVPEPNTLPTDTYTLEVTPHSQTVVLAQDVQVEDIPAQPYESEATLNPCDFDADGDVDLSDLALLCSHWLGADYNHPNWRQGTDVDYSGSVNFVDFAIFANNWLEGTAP